MKITALIENTTAHKGCLAEHGLSLLIEANGRVALFDAGQSGGAFVNAARLGIDLASVDAAILSHGHYDHANGFPAFFGRNATAPLYVHAGYDLPHFHGEKYIGVAPELRECHRIIKADDREDLGGGFTIISYADREPVIPIDSDGLEEDAGSGRMPEQFLHEQYLIVGEGPVRMLVSGCSHRGIANIMRWSADEGITHVVGGFHLMRTPADDPRIEAVARELLSHPACYLTCHCTGTEQYGRLKGLMGTRLGYLAAGDAVEF